MRLQTKLLLVVFVLMTISLLSVLLTIQYWQRSIELRLISNSELLLAKRSEVLLQSVTDARRTLGLLAHSGVMVSARLDAIRNELRSWDGSASNFEGFYYFSLAGEVFPAEGEALSVLDRPYFPLIQQGKAVTGVPLTSRVTGGEVLLITAPLHDLKGELAGALGATVLLRELLGTAIRDTPGANSALIVLDAQGNLLAGGMGENVMPLSAPLPDLAPITSGVISGLGSKATGKEVVIETIPVMGESYRVFSSLVPELGWRMVYVQPEAALMESLSDARRLAWLILLGLLLAAAVVIHFLQRSILKPVQALRNAQEKVQEGDLSVRLQVSGDDEFAKLAESFNRMVTALEASERRFRVVFEAFPHPIFLNRMSDGRYVDVNPAFASQCDKERSELVGRTMQEIGVIVDPESARAQGAELLTKGRLDGITLNTSSASHEPQWAICSSRLIELDGEQVALSVTTDISELKAIEASLKESEASFTALFQLAPVPLAYADERDGFSATHWNDAWYRTFGYSWKEADGRSGADIGTWAFSADRKRYITTAITDGAVDGFETQLRRKDGALRHCIIYGHFARAGGRRLLLTAYLDVTESRRAEREIRSSESTLKALFNASPVAMIVSDAARAYATVAANEAWLQQFQRELATTLGLNEQQMGIWANLDDRQHILEQVMAQGEASGYETEFIRGDGERLLCRLAARRFPAGDDELLVMVQEDITEQRQAEHSLQDLNQRLAQQVCLAEAISRAQSKFIVNTDIGQVFGTLLSDLLKLTSSEYGFIGEVFYKPDGKPYLKTSALTNIAWDDATRSFFDDNSPTGLEFHNLDTLLGSTMTSGETVIANTPANDPRSGGLPPGHPAMNAFLGVPIHAGGQLVAMAGLANRPGGYDQQLADWLHPLMSTTGQIVAARRIETARQRAEAIVLRFRYMVDHANDAMFLLDGSFIVECNPAALKIFGCQRAQLIGHTLFEFSPSQQADGSNSRLMAETYLENVRCGIEQRFEWLHNKADGTLFMAEVALGSFGEGNEKRVIAVLRDITERKRIEAEVKKLNTSLEERVRNRTHELAARNTELAEALHTLEVARACLAENEHRLSGVMAATGEGIWDWQVTKDSLFNSPRWCEMLGFVPDGNDYGIEVITARLLDEERSDVMHAVKLCLDGHKPYRHEHRMRRCDGSVFWVQDRGDVTERDAQGRALRMMGSISDITDRKQTELALAEAKIKTEAANVELAATLDNLRRAQDELLRTEKLASLGALVAGVAHELNTPIGNAVTVSSTLVDAQKHFADQIRSGLSRSALNAFVDTVGEAGQILDRNLHRAAELVGSFKQLAVDQSSYQRRPFDLAELVHEITLAMGPALRKTQHKVRVEVAPGLLLDSYPGPLGQILMNLINNALIHAFAGKDSGTIHIQARTLESGWISLVVSDDGRGISAENQKRIFDPFFTTRLGQGGSGLGLHIVFSLVVDLLGGRIDVTSAPGEGAAFRLRIPAAAPQQTMIS